MESAEQAYADVMSDARDMAEAEMQGAMEDALSDFQTEAEAIIEQALNDAQEEALGEAKLAYNAAIIRHGVKFCAAPSPRAALGSQSGIPL
jgi:hypothetical protein